MGGFVESVGIVEPDPSDSQFKLRRNRKIYFPDSFNIIAKQIEAARAKWGKPEREFQFRRT